MYVRLQDGVAPLHAAAEAGHRAVVDRLIAAGADVEARDQVDSTHTHTHTHTHTQHTYKRAHTHARVHTHTGFLFSCSPHAPADIECKICHTV